MERLLQEAFDVVAPALGTSLAAQPLRAQLSEGLGVLAPVLQVGLECPLAEGASRVDVQQAFVASDGAHYTLADYVARLVESRGEILDPAWHRMHALLQHWLGGAYEGVLTELWLEYDVTQTLTPDSVPSVFIQVPGRGHAARELTQEVTVLMWGRPIVPALERKLVTCFEGAPGEAWVSHVGMMVSRPVDALRVNLKGLRAEDVDGLLARLGWRGEEYEVGARMEWLLQYADDVTVCLDLGERVFPRIGLEAFFHDPPSVEPEWRALLDALVREGACTEAKRDALLEWEGISGPPQAAAPWPGELIAQALEEPERFSVIARRLNHIKAIYQPDRPLEAKAYLGFGHLWGTPES